ncbi:MAG: Rv3235 family protein [Propionibacteriaceae bacterium]|jgi:hypothetical protein|nr:Rv3235 family protein [Propionibacteriaceae bacterium]
MPRLDPAPRCQPLCPAFEPTAWSWRQDWRPRFDRPAPGPSAGPATVDRPGGGAELDRLDPDRPELGRSAPDRPAPELRPGAPLDRATALGLRLARASVEVLNGQRPLEQLENWFDGPALAALQAQIGPCRAVGGVKALSLRAQTPHPAAVEVCLGLGLASRRLAGLMAVSRREGGWLCTDWRLIGRPVG